jgi:tetratricopeptide (TPR) repeat protein
MPATPTKISPASSTPSGRSDTNAVVTPDQRHAQAQHHHRAGDLARAESLYRAALAHDPAHADSLHQLARIALATGHAEAALPLLDQAIKLKPRNAAFRDAFGQALLACGRLAEAVAAYRHAVRLDKSSPAAICNLAGALTAFGDHAEATQCLRRAIALDPSYKPAIIQLGIACQRTGDFPGAEQAVRRAIELTPDDPRLLSDLAILLHLQGRAPEAATAFTAALERAPDDAKILARLAVWHRDTGDLAAAEAHFRAALSRAPIDPMLHYGLAHTLLAAGKWREGFAEHEWRWQAHNIAPPNSAPAWTGAPGTGTLLITAEQGQGDVIHFLRYVPRAAARIRVVLEIYPPLRRLAESLPSIAAIISPGDPTPPHDAICPLLSLPRALGLDEAPLAMETPYLHPDPTAIAPWSARLATLPGRKIGLAWAGAAEFDFDRRRSIPPSRLDALADPTISFISLQKNPAAKPNLPLTDWTAELHDFAATAALIANLDLVIAVDTAVAHLAGALGKPIWLLNRFDADWRWQRAGDHSAWYPSLRQFRQPKPGDWTPVITAIRAALRETQNQTALPAANALDHAH